MTLLDYDAMPATAQTVVTKPVITETVEVTPSPMSEASAYLTKSDDQWTWGDLRDYVVHEIETRFGPWPRDSKKEYGIFNRFLSQWGPLAPRIARHAFETCDGWWSSAPVRIERFCRGSDPYFAVPIAERLTGR